MKRPHIKLKTKLASALCQMMRPVGDGEWEKIIPHTEAKKLSEDQILAKFDFHHHPIPKAHDGPDTHWNLEPIETAPHKEITAKVDIPRIAKTKRLAKEQEAFRTRVLARDPGEKRQRKSKIPSKPFPKGRGFAQASR